jgi:hypothetical protein
VLSVHNVVREAQDLRARLHYQSLGFFLQVCQKLIGAEWHSGVMRPEIEKALDIVELHNEHNSVWTSPEDADNTDDADSKQVLSAVQQMVSQVARHIRESATSLTKEHGALLKHASVEDLMKKLAISVDVDTARVYWEQVCVLHTTQLALARREDAENLEWLANWLGERLSVKAAE